MKIVWNTCKREPGGVKSVSAMETTTKSLYENLQRQLPFKETYVKYLGKNSSK